MKGTIRRKKLVDALRAVKPGLASKELIEQSTKFAFVNGDLVTYNDEISIRYPLPDLGDLTGAVSSSEMYKLVDKLSYKTLRFEVKGPELMISSGRVRMGLVLDAEIKLPFDEVDTDRVWVKVPDSLIEAFMFVVPACSNDLSLQILTCVHCDTELARVEASDTIRYARHEFEDFEDDVDSFLLPVQTVRELSAYEFESLSVGDSWVHFRTKDGAEVSCRRAEGEEDNEEAQYPSTEKFDFDGPLLELPKGLAEALDIAHVLADRAYELTEEVEIQIRPGRFILRAKGPAGWIKESLPSDYKGKPVKLVTNPSFLADACRKKSVARLGDDKLRFEGEGWVYVVALIG